MWQLLAAAGLQAGAQLGSGLLSSKGARDANRQSAKIAQQQNELNYKMFQEQNAFNREMWSAQNAYNTPEAQRQRLEQAGINPYLAMSNIQTGQAQGVTSAVPAPAAGYQHQNELAGLAAGVSAAGGIAMQAAMLKKAQAEAKSIEIDNVYRGVRAEAEIDKLSADTRLSHTSADLRVADIELRVAQGDLLKVQADEIRQLTPAKLDSLRQQISASITDQQLADVNKRMQEYELKNIKPYVARQIKADIGRIYAYTQYLVDQSGLTQSQAKLVGVQVLTEAYRSYLTRSQAVQIMANLPFDLLHKAASTTNIQADTGQKRAVTNMVNKELAWKDVQNAVDLGQSILDLGTDFLGSPLRLLFKKKKQ